MSPVVLAIALAGLLVGSFLNVVVFRLPLGRSVVGGRSFCPSCEAPVRAYDNVPVLSWLALRGRCRSCAAAISARYPLVELGTALLLAAVAVVDAGDTARLVLGLVLCVFLVPMALIDLEHRIIPNRLTLPAAVLAVVLGTALDPGGEVARLAAGAGAGGFFLVAAILKPNGMGMGDVKLAGVLGLFLGPVVAVALLVALVLGVLVGAVIIARKGAAAGRRTAVPFGPFLAVGGVVALLAGAPLLDAYLATF